MKPELARLLLLSCACLVGLAVSAAMLVRDQRRANQRADRIAGIASAHRQSRSSNSATGYRLSLKLQGATLTSRIAKLLRYNTAHRAIYPVGPTVVLTIALVLAVVAARALSSSIGLMGWAGVPITTVLLCRSFYGWHEDRLMMTLYNQFPDALAMIVRAVRVGLPMIEAIRVVARENPEPTAREFSALVAQTAIGVPLEDALREMAERNRLPEYRFLPPHYRCKVRLVVALPRPWKTSPIPSANGWPPGCVVTRSPPKPE